MTTEEFEQWLIKKAEEANSNRLLESKSEEVKDKVAAIVYRIVSGIYEDVLEKYKSILPPPTTLN